MNLIKSSGLILYEQSKLIVQVDPGITSLYRSLIPKCKRVQRQKYSPHITVVRNENVSDVSKCEGLHLQEVEFLYDTEIRNDDVYWWLNVYCPRLNCIRIDLGLPEWSDLCRPPDGSNNFHTTIGNTK